MRRLLKEADLNTLKAWRQDFHKHPELGFEEFRTSRLVAERLDTFKMDKITTNVGKTGVVATLHGLKQEEKRVATILDKDAKRPSFPRTVALRADMDALPMNELGNCEYKSIYEGKFHGCGHDGHTTCLLGAAKYLSENRGQFSGTVHFVFQPAEEGLGGAKKMIEEGFNERFKSDYIFAIHNWPGLPVGMINVQAGPIMASSDEFDIKLEGVGGHAAMPHKCVDTIYVGSLLVQAIQGLVSRENDPAEPLVISVTKFIGNSGAYNVIPSSISLSGTLRCFSPNVRSKVMDRLKGWRKGFHIAMFELIRTALVSSFSLSFDVNASVSFHEFGYPPTINDEDASRLARLAAIETVGMQGLTTKQNPSLGAEDFSIFLEKTKGAYVWLGADSVGRKSYALHHPLFDFNDELIDKGVALYANMALSGLRNQ